MNTDNGQVHLIEDDLQLTRKLDWLKLTRVKNISGTSRRSGKSYQAMLFCDCPDLLKELMFIGADGGGYLIHDKYQMIDALIHLRVYYIDGRDYYNRRFMYHFYDQRVDQVQVNDFSEQVKGWRVTGARGNHVHVEDDTQQALLAFVEETIEL